MFVSNLMEGLTQSSNNYPETIGIMSKLYLTAETDTATGRTSKEVTLHFSDVVIINIPPGAEFTGRMWLI